MLVLGGVIKAAWTRTAAASSSPTVQNWTARLYTAVRFLGLILTAVDKIKPILHYAFSTVSVGYLIQLKYNANSSTYYIALCVFIKIDGL